MSHRFVTVRRGSPAARSGQVQPGDQLDAVEGRPVAGLQHRDLAQILRRAGNTLRLSITPRHHSSSLPEGADLDIDGRMMKGPRGRSKEESKFYSVDLERGPTGFGFSLRGGSEYNMGLYVLGLMDGGPAQRSSKIQVSDQLVEINGDSTAGMTHSQAVEQIRRGGHRIHLVLKKGNGYVPDYVELSSLSLCMTNSKQGEPCFYVIGRTENSRGKGSDPRSCCGSGSLAKYGIGHGRGCALHVPFGHFGPEEGALSPSSSSHTEEQDMDMVTMTTASLSRQMKRGSGTGEGSGAGEGERRRRERETKRKTGGGGLGPPDLDLDLVEEEARVLERRQQEEEEEEEERKRRSQTVRQKKRDDQKEQGRRSRSLPRSDARPRDSPLLEERMKESRRRGGERERGKERDNSTNRCAKHAGSSAASQKAAFSFLMPLDDDNSDRRLSDSESAASFSELSLSAASIATAGLREESDWRRDELEWQEGDTPGPWLKPSQQRLTQVLMGSRLRGRELVGGLSL